AARRFHLLLPNVVHGLLECQPIKSRQRQRKQKADAAIEEKKCVSEGTFDFSSISHNCGWVWNSPVGGHGLTWPDRAYFVGSIVANREHEVQMRRVGLCKLVPALAAQPLRGEVSPLQLRQSLWSDRPRWVTARAVGREGRPSSVVQNGFSHDRPGGISRTQEKNVAMSDRHSTLPD